MLLHLVVRNFAIIDDLSVDFHQGMSVITGTSGAGKSIILSALQFALGQRADKDMVQAGKDSAHIVAEFSVTTAAAATFLYEHNLTDEKHCILRRVISADGRSRAFINDIPVSLTLLQQLTPLLIDISSQNQHQLLLRSEQQLHILDTYAENTELLTTLATTAKELKAVQQQITEITQHNHNNQERLEFLTFALEELRAEELDQEKLDTIEERHKQYNNLAKISQTLQQSIQYIEDAEGASNKALDELTQAIHLDDSLTEAHSVLEGAKINLTEANYLLSNYLSKYDGVNNEDLEQQLSRLYDLARKHRCNITELVAKTEEIEQEIHTLAHQDTQLEELRARAERLTQHYHTLSTELSTQRATSAQELNTKVSATMQELGMANAEFVAQLHHREGVFTMGNDTIEFVIDTGSGVLRPLKKIASGGELSRIWLAIAVITTSSAHAPTLIFDEVDTGISGETATIIGKKLRTLAKNYQVLCITHLPQVAAQGEHHIFINKEQGVTTLTYLDTGQRTQEIARILGDAKGAHTLNLAQELISK